MSYGTNVSQMIPFIGWNIDSINKKRLIQCITQQKQQQHDEAVQGHCTSLLDPAAILPG